MPTVVDLLDLITELDRATPQEFPLRNTGSVYVEAQILSHFLKARVTP